MASSGPPTDRASDRYWWAVPMAGVAVVAAAVLERIPAYVPAPGSYTLCHPPAAMEHCTGIALLLVLLAAAAAPCGFVASAVKGLRGALVALAVVLLLASAADGVDRIGAGKAAAAARAQAGEVRDDNAKCVYPLAFYNVTPGFFFPNPILVPVGGS